MKRLLIFILLLSGSIAGFCQAAGGWHPYFLSISKAQGLPSDEVYDMMEDNRGFMWLATGAGLTRYDGHTFKTWQSASQTSTSGSCIQQDKLGRIWYENFDGYLYYTEGTQLRQLKQRTPGAYRPYSITARHLFVVASNGVDVYDINTLKAVKRIEIPYTRYEHSAPGAWGIVIVADGILYRVDTTFRVSSQKLTESTTYQVHQTYCHGDSIFVFSRSTGQTSMLIFEDRHSAPSVAPIYSDGQLRSVFRIKEAMWVCSTDGCRCIEHDKSRLLFPGKSISAVTGDSKGNTWFATTNEGIFIVPELTTNIANLNGRKVTQVAAVPYGILAGTQNGDLLLLPAGTDKTEVLHHDPQNADIYYLYADSTTILYSASGFTMLQRNGKVFRNGVIAVKSVYPFNKEYYAVAASGTCGLIYRWGKPVIDPSTHNKLSASIDTCILADVRGRATVYDAATGTLIFATNRGMVTISPTGKKRMVLCGKQPIYAASVALRDGVVYASDTKGSLLRFAPGDTNAVAVKAPGSGRIKLLQESNGHIYYTAGRRLYELGNSDSARPLHCHIDADAINDIAASDTVLWLATNAGMIAYRTEPARGTDTAHATPFYINAIRVNDREAGQAQLTSLAPGSNNIAIDYSVVEFAQPEPAIVSYKLNDGTWTELSNDDRTLQFRSLAPGQYTVRFRVNGRDTNAVFKFNIQSHFWQQLWFYMLCALAALAVGQVLYHRRVKRQMRKMEEQQQKSQLEEQLSRSMLTALRSQMNPHFFFNALNTIQAYIFTNEKTKAGNYLSKFSMLTRTILEMSETESVVLQDEIAAMKLYLELEKMRFGDDFEYTIDLSGIRDTAAIEIPSMILQPFIENAVKHGLMHKEGPKKLAIHCERTGSVVRVTVEDNGIGRSRSQALNEIKKHKYKSYSTRATAERVRLLNEQQPGKISVEITDKMNENGSPAGTTVTITINT